MMEWDIFWKASSVILPVITAIYAFIATRRKDLDRKFEEGRARMDRHAARLDRLDQTVQTMPGKDETHRLHVLMVEMAGDMKAMRASMDGMQLSMARTEDIVGRHEEHLRGTH